MISIILTNNCNLKCSYCFAKNISFSYLLEENLNYILSLLKINNLNNKCFTCNYYKNSLCSNGCLGFKKG